MVIIVEKRQEKCGFCEDPDERTERTKSESSAKERSK